MTIMKNIFLLLLVFIGLKASAQNVHVLNQDINTTQQISIWIPGIGFAASDTVTHYSYANIDSMPNALTNSTGAYLGGEYQGWMTATISGGWIKTLVPYFVIGGHSEPAGHPWRTSGLEQNNYNIQDSAGQVGYYLTQLTNMPGRDVGIGGQTSTQIRARFRRDFIGINDVVGDGKTLPVLLHKPSFIILWATVNDAFNGVPLQQTEANMTWMAEQAMEYQIPIVILNCVGQGLSVSQTQLNQIAAINQWYQSGVLQALGATVFDVNSTWNSGAYGGVSSYNNNNYNFSSLVNSGDGIHMTQVGYDSVAQQIFRICKLPVLTKIVFESVLNPVNPPANFNRPTGVTISGKALYGTGTQTFSTSYTLANQSYDTVNVTAPILTDTATITITSSTNVSGSAVQSGWSNIYYYLTNNPNNQVWITQKAPYRGAYTGFVNADSIHIQVPNDVNGVASLLVTQSAGAAYGDALRLVSGGGGAALNINQLNLSTTLTGALNVYNSGGIGINTTGSVIASETATPHQLGSFQFANGSATSTGFGFGLYNNSFNIQAGASATIAGNLYTFTPYTAIAYNTGSSNKNYSSIMVAQTYGSSLGSTDTLGGIVVQQTQADTTTTTLHGFFQGLTINHIATSLGNQQLLGFVNNIGDNYFNTVGYRTIVGDAAGQVLGEKMIVSDTASAFLPPRVTKAQRNKFGYLSGITISGTMSGYTNYPKITITTTQGRAPRASCNISGGVIISCTILDPGADLTGATVTITASNFGTGAVLTPVITVADAGAVCYLTDSGYNSTWNGSAWIPMTTGGGVTAIGSPFFVSTANGTALTNTTAATALGGTGTGSGGGVTLVPSTSLTVGRTIHVHGSFVYSTGATNTTFSIAPLAITATFISLPASQTNAVCIYDLDVVIITSGGSGTYVCTGTLTFPGQLTNSTVVLENTTGSSTTTSISTSSGLDFQPYGQWGTASSSNSIQSTAGYTIKVQ